MTIYNANVSNIRRSVVDAVSPEDCEPYPNTQVQPIAWYAEVAGGPFALRVHDVALLYEMQNPKQQLFLSGAVVCPAGAATILTPFLDLQQYRKVGWWIQNTGAQVVTSVTTLFSPDPIGAISAYEGVVTPIAAWGGVVYSQAGFAAVVGGGTQWRPGYDAGAVFPYFQLVAMSTLGTSAVACVWGMR